MKKPNKEILDYYKENYPFDEPIFFCNRCKIFFSESELEKRFESAQMARCPCCGATITSYVSFQINDGYLCTLLWDNQFIYLANKEYIAKRLLHLVEDDEDIIDAIKKWTRRYDEFNFIEGLLCSMFENEEDQIAGLIAIVNEKEYDL